MALKQTSIHRHDALRLLEDGEPHKLRVWKLSTGDIITYADAIHSSADVKTATHRVRLKASGQIRKLRDVLLFEIDDLSVYF